MQSYGRETIPKPVTTTVLLADIIVYLNPPGAYTYSIPNIFTIILYYVFIVRTDLSAENVLGNARLEGI